MKKIVLSAAAGVCLAVWSCNVFAAPAASEPVSEKKADGVWLTDMAEAQAAAREQKKAIFVDFTGSDWCPWCVRLHDEVLKQKPFLDYAAKNLVLLLVDFPRDKWQTPAQKKANEALAQKYGIQGYPTILLLDADGKVIGKTGYRRGGAGPYVKHLEELLGK